MADDECTGKTFFLNTPADLLEKLRWEHDALWTSLNNSVRREKVHVPSG